MTSQNEFSAQLEEILGEDFLDILSDDSSSSIDDALIIKQLRLSTDRGLGLTGLSPTKQWLQEAGEVDLYDPELNNETL
jgi:hypothetical protein